MSYSSTITADSPIYYWKLDEASGTSFAATAGSTSLTGSGAITTGVAGVDSHGVAFAAGGSANALSCTGLSDYLSLTNFTAELWFKYSPYTGNPTMMRRDSGAIFILRMVGTDQGSNAGKIQAYYNGVSIFSPSTYTDGAWHHVAFVKSGTGATLYVDGSSVATGTVTTGSSASTTIAQYFGGSNTTFNGEEFKGSLDEIAIFNTALSGTRIAAHHTAGVPVSNTFTASAATATATMPTSTVGGYTQVSVTLTPTADTYVYSGSPSTNYNTATLLEAAPATTVLLNFGQLPSSAVKVNSATLTWTPGSGLGSSSATAKAQNIAGSWVATTVTYSTAPTVSGAASASTTLSATAATSMNVASIVSAWLTGTTNNGIAIVTTSGGPNFSYQSETGAAPTLALVYQAVATPVTVTASPMTASAVLVAPTDVVGRADVLTALAASVTAVMPAPTVVAQVNRTVTAAVATATATMGDARTASIRVSAAVMTASASFVSPTVHAAQPRIVAAAPMTASASIVTATFSNITQRTVLASPMTATATLPYYLAAGDLYVIAVSQAVAATNAPIWLRFEEPPGSTEALNSATGTYLAYHGTPDFNVPAPFGRKAVHFSGDDYIEVVPQSLEPIGTTVARGAYEFVFRTTEANTTIFGGVGSGGLNAYESGVAITSGKVTAFGEFGNYTSRKSVNDGQWHHVVIVWDGGTTEFIIDGISDLLRFSLTETVVADIGKVDFYTTVDYIGDLDELVVYNTNISRHDAFGHYYAWRLATAATAATATATASMPDAKGKGNKLRALGLFYDGDGSTETGINIETHGVLGVSDDLAPFDWNNYRVFPQAIRGFTDDYDTSPRYINLMTDIDVSDYDLVFFIDTPPRTGVIFGGINETISNAVIWLDLVDSLRAAQDAFGFALWVPQPQLAADLGIVGHIATNSLLREADDPYAYTIDGHRGALTNYQPDNQFLDAYRIVREVEGLTDLDGYVITDVVNYNDPTRWLDINGSWFAYNIEARPNGLAVGDLLRFESATQYYDLGNAETDAWLAAYPRPQIVGAPVDDVVGTVVAQGQATVNNGGVWADSPVKDLALTIAVEKGTLLKGRATNGRIFVNFMDIYSSPGVVFEQVAKTGSGFSYDTRRVQQTIANIAYIDYSTNTQGQNVSLPTSQVLNDPDTLVHPFYGMTYRGLNWLAQAALTEPDGFVTVRPAAMTATASMPAVRVGVVRSTTVHASAMQAIATSRFQDTDVDAFVFAAEATASMVSPRRPHTTSAAVATATLVQPTLNVTGEFIVFKLKNFSPVFVLEEI